MSGSFTGWLVDTFVYTAILIGLVLVLRRPVARYFGPQVAYALWALPALRFVMPPIILPAAMAPVQMAAPAHDLASMGISNPVLGDTAEPIIGVVTGSGASMVDQLVPFWLAGALAFLVLRWRNYRRMRDQLLADARPVGESGKVRLVETSAVRAPVAFGVLDKVVALPPAFMAHHNRAARDLAIDHELAHHRGHDLLANFAAQPVLALHWFNPLAWLGWRAMRRDQEAACDARVVAGRGRSERAAYAQIIAGFAVGDDLGLAAAMACPVLGEKSIIQRLRCLTRSEISDTRRHIGLAALATAALSLPLTASISYAQPRLNPQPRKLVAGDAKAHNPGRPLPAEPGKREPAIAQASAQAAADIGHEAAASAERHDPVTDHDSPAWEDRSKVAFAYYPTGAELLQIRCKGDRPAMAQEVSGSIDPGVTCRSAVDGTPTATSSAMGDAVAQTSAMPDVSRNQLVQSPDHEPRLQQERREVSVHLHAANETAVQFSGPVRRTVITAFRFTTGGVQGHVIHQQSVSFTVPVRVLDADAERNAPPIGTGSSAAWKT